MSFNIFEPKSACHTVEVCPALHIPINGSLSTDSVVFGTVVEVTCDHGYHFPLYNQMIVVECLEGMVWNATIIPDCDREFCATQHRSDWLFEYHDTVLKGKE